MPKDLDEIMSGIDWSSQVTQSNKILESVGKEATEALNESRSKLFAMLDDHIQRGNVYWYNLFVKKLLNDSEEEQIAFGMHLLESIITLLTPASFAVMIISPKDSSPLTFIWQALRAQLDRWISKSDRTTILEVKAMSSFIKSTIDKVNIRDFEFMKSMVTYNGFVTGWAEDMTPVAREYQEFHSSSFQIVIAQADQLLQTT